MSGSGKQVQQGDHESDAAAITPDGAGGEALVLIVEDERPIADAIRMVVEDAGYQPIIAYTGQNGLGLARAMHPALVTTDYMMPGMNGGEFIAAMRADAAKDARLAPPIIMISAITSPQVHKSGYDEFLEKPFDIEDLTKLLHRYLRHAQPVSQTLPTP